MHPDGLRQIIALIRFYFHEDVEETQDGISKINVDRLFRSWEQLKFALQFHGKLSIKEPIKG